MTHEFKKIVHTYLQAQKEGLKTVLATVVAVDGSSYRGAGVRMLVVENNKTVGAISGGCVEKEVVHQAQSVFATRTAKIMTYDGRFRLGCEGTLYVLLENFSMEAAAVEQIEQSFQRRETFEIRSYYSLSEEERKMGSLLTLQNGNQISLSKQQFQERSASTYLENTNDAYVFKESLAPCFQLLLMGIEHDARSLCILASHMGWEVTVIGAPNTQKNATDFPGHTAFVKTSPELFETTTIDEQTAIVLMSHNYAKDLSYLKVLKDCKAIYIGLLGATRRKELLLSAFIEYDMDVSLEFLDKIYGPAGLDIGSETPEEIAVSIISEILAITRSRKGFHLQEKKGAIHEA